MVNKFSLFITCIILTISGSSMAHDEFAPKDLRPEQFGGFPDDGVDDAPAFSAMFEACKRIVSQRNVKNFTVGPRPNIILSGGGTYHLASTPTLVPKCLILSENITDIQWIGPPGGIMFRMANKNGRPAGSPHVFWRMRGVRFNRQHPPNGFPYSIVKLDYEDGADTTHLVDLGWTFEDVRFSRTTGPALDIGVGVINMDLRNNVRFDIVDTAIRWYVGPRTCNFRGQIAGSTVHDFRTFLQVDDEAGKCVQGIKISDMRIEALPKGGQYDKEGVERQLIEYNYWGDQGSTSDHLWVNVTDVHGQVKDRENWVIHRSRQHFDHTGRYLGLTPTMRLSMVTLAGPAIGGHLHPDMYQVPEWTDPQQLQFMDWLIVRTPEYRKWKRILHSPLD